MLVIDPSAYGRSDLYDVALARRVAGHLGRGVLLTRSGNVSLPLTDRHALARRTRAHTYLSLDAAEGSDAVWVHPSASPASRALAERVASALGQRLEVGAPPQLEPQGLPSRAASCHVVVDPQRDFHDVASRLAGALYGNVAEAQRVGPPPFDPRNPGSWLRDLATWTADLSAFIAGVPDAAHEAWPHSSICKLYTRKADGSGYSPPGPAPTGFFIAPDRIATNAHVTQGVVSCQVAPGEHNNTPANSFTVSGASRFKVHPRYGNSAAFDLGVIKLERPVPGVRVFDLQELQMSVSRGISLCGYAAQVDDLARDRWQMDPAIDPNKQHLSRGGATSNTTTEVWNYTIQALPGSSGAPVWWFDDSGRLKVIGIHSRGRASTPRFNEGVRLTRDKIRWLRTV